MKKLLMSSVLLLLIVPMLTTVWAQQRGAKAMKKQMYSRQYDTNTVETIEGEVAEVIYNPSKKNNAMTGVHMLVKTKSQTVSVHLGPLWYMKQQAKFKKGDKVTITGSRVVFNGAPALIAATIKRNQMTLRLRDRNGYPVWKGWRMSGKVNR